MKKIALIKKMFRERRIDKNMAISAIQFLNHALSPQQAIKILES